MAVIKKSAAKKAKAKPAITEVASGSEIEVELLNTLGVDAQGDDEERQEYLERIGNTCNDDDILTQEKYDALSEESQNWWAKAAALILKDKPVPEFPDVVEEEEDTETTDEGEEEEQEEEAGEEEGQEEEDTETTDEGEEEVTAKKSAAKKGAVKKSAAKTPAKAAAKTPAKAAAKKPASKANGAARSGDGYKGHRSGTKVEKAHKLYDDLVAKKKDRATIIPALQKCGITKATANTWYQVFSKS